MVNSLKWRRLARFSTILTLGVFLVWFGSLFLIVGWTTQTGTAIAFGQGFLYATNSIYNYERIPGWFLEYDPGILSWWFDGFNDRNGWFAGIPFWMVFLPCAIFAVVARWKHRRVVSANSAGLCSSCGYNRAGIDSASPCPECGKARIVAS